MPEPVLYLVGTPIGNLDDLSPRALATLTEVDVVYAEDTRRTSRLFRRHAIRTPLRSLHAHNEAARGDEIVGLLRGGGNCALVTDAGSPGVSDPGARVVRAVADAGLLVLSVPGPSAVTAAVGLSGFDADRFLFLGFPPRKGPERRAWLAASVTQPTTVVAFEAPGRLAALLRDWAEMEIGERPCCVCREITKLHEETRRGTVAALADYYSEVEPRGEITLVLAAASPPAAVGGARAREVAEEMARTGRTTKEIATRLRDELGLSRNEAYELALRATSPGGQEP
jgi:16S rRNA (cytidine1402-2'-O)-methyltransferase